MKAPGVTVRPVKLASGSHDVNEVFFDEVRIPDSQRLGGVGQGFGVAMDTLVIERYAAADEAGFGPTLPLFIERAKKATINGRPAIEDGRTRREIARSEEHTSELQSLMRISYAVFCLKKKTIH